MSQGKLLGMILAVTAAWGLVTPTLAVAQESTLPTVTAAQVPLYPALARQAHIEGIVHITITADGHAVIKTHVEDGHAALAKSAEENVRTWQFATHTPVTYMVTFHYRLSSDSGNQPNNPTVILRLPTDVEIVRYPVGSQR